MSLRSTIVAVIAGVVTAGAVVAITHESPSPALAQGRAVQRPVGSATLSCPGTTPPASGASAPLSLVSAVAPPVSTGSPTRGLRSGTLQVESPTPGSPVPSTVRRGTLVSTALDEVGARSLRGGATVSATGSVAPGAAAVQFGGAERAVTPAKPGKHAAPPTAPLTASWCLSPRPVWWFTGADTTVGSTSSLVLVDPGPSTAVVALRLFGPKGEVSASGLSAMAVPAHGRTVIDLARFAPDLADLSVSIVASRGSIAAALLVQRENALTPAGADWLPPGSPPARRTVVDAGLAPVGQQQLVIVNPGDRQRVVAVRILSAQGAFTSTSLRHVQVPPQSVVVRPLSPATEGAANAVELRSRGPVTGAIESELVHGSQDVCWSAPSSALGQEAVAPTLPGARTSIAFAVRGPRPAEVSIQQFSAQGVAGTSVRVSLPGRSTTVWHAPVSGSTGYSVVTRSFGAGISATIGYQRVNGIAQLPLLSGVWTVTRPLVLP